MEKQAITEEMGIHNEWYAQAKDLTLEQLPNFLNELMNDYYHDYGTICHALAAGAIATMWAMDKHPKQGGITGFQAGAIMWQLIRQWNYSDNKTGLKIIDYDKFLYPQYEDKFRKTIASKIWKSIQKQAQDLIEEADKNCVKYQQDLIKYQTDLAQFVEKHPDYYERHEYYSKLSCGTAEEWEAEESKKASGFEFAPQEPYCSVNPYSPVYKHWQSIVKGIVPFGYTVVDD